MKEQTKMEIQEYSPIDAALSALREKYHGKIYDVTTGPGMAEARTARREIKGYRVDLEKIRKQIKAPALERCRMIDAEAKRITEALEEIECPIDDQIKAEEQRIQAAKEAAEKAERERVESIRHRIGLFDQAINKCVGASAEKIQEILDWMAGEGIVGFDFMEFSAEATQKHAEATGRIERALDDAKRNEAEAERLRLEREQLERERAAEAERAEKARAAAEKERMEAEARAREEREALEAERAAFEAEKAAAAAAAEQPEAEPGAESEDSSDDYEIVDDDGNKILPLTTSPFSADLTATAAMLNWVNDMDSARREKVNALDPKDLAAWERGVNALWEDEK